MTTTDIRYYRRLLVDHVPSMLAYWDKDLRCRFANRAYERWFGVDPDQLIDTSIRDLLGEQLFALNEPFMRAALAGQAQTFERIVPGPDGVQRHALAQYIPDVVDGEVRGFVVQVTEVTQLKETQAALQREQQLRRQVEEHAARLDALLRERTEMLDVLAHEVRQPLNNASAALQSAQSALDGESDAAATDCVLRARAVLSQVLSGIDNTLAVASLLARPEPIALDDADVDTLVAVVIADMPVQERDRIRVQRDTATHTAAMDMSLIRLALRNLLSNALKFSPPGSPVRLRIADSDAPLALVIEVGDLGPGIASELQPQLFSRGARSGRHSGLGLGLYIVRQVMTLHGGTVELMPAEAGGATLRLTIAQSLAG
jgi:PAS domain S-box-containing protein